MHRRSIAPIVVLAASVAAGAVLAVGGSPRSEAAGVSAGRQVVALLACDTCSRATPPPGAISFGSGVHVVGQDVPAGTYRTRSAPDLCYWERLGSVGGEPGTVIANGVGSWPMVVTILPTDAAFRSDACGTWTNDLSPITQGLLAPFAAGTYLVGVDIAPGAWRSDGQAACSWERLRGFTGDPGEVIDADVAVGPVTVTVAAADAGFQSLGCGTWTRVG